MPDLQANWNSFFAQTSFGDKNLGLAPLPWKMDNVPIFQWVRAPG